MPFSWDQNKSDANRIKHGISFEQAKEVFDDRNAIVDTSSGEHDEERWIAIGKTMMVFTVRGSTIRIISARQARKNEIKDYLGQALNKERDDEADKNE
jgi:uncharacterized protein